MSDENRFESVWDAIEDTPAQAANMRLRSQLMMALRDHIAREGLTQVRAAAILGITQLTTDGTRKTATSAAKLTTLADSLKNSVSGFKLA